MPEGRTAGAKDALLRMRHDLRSPVAVIVGLAQVMKGELTDEEHKQDLEYIISSGRELESLVDDFVGIVRDLTSGGHDDDE